MRTRSSPSSSHPNRSGSTARRSWARNSPSSFEPLESRRLLASIVVTSTADTVNPGDGLTTLREAITQANNQAGADSIVLAAGATYTINGVDNSLRGDNGLPPIQSEITIEGNGATIARSSSGSTPAFRLFFVGGFGGSDVGIGAPGNLTLNNVTLSNGLSKGAGGEPGGGGGAGMGGAIFSRGTVKLNGVLILNNKAQGGYGGVRATGSPGDGGAIGASSQGEGGGAQGGVNGGNGSFGAGGGKASTGKGGNGGFGAGGGSTGSPLDGNRGQGGLGGGRGNVSNGAGGGGAGFGGAVFNDGGDLTVTNSTLTANSAVGGSGHVNGNGWGGAIFSHGGSVTLLNATLSANTAEAGTDAFMSSVEAESAATLVAYNSILGQATITASSLAQAGSVDYEGDNNLIRNSTATTDSTFGFSTADPKLGPLANNGGLSRTFSLLNGSPAINSGDNARVPAGVTTDQRGPGFARFAQGGVDIGAFEATTGGPASSIYVSDISEVEGDFGERTLVFTITRVGDNSTDVTFRAETQDGTAVEQLDYIPTAGTLAFFANSETTRTLSIRIKSDTLAEGNETFKLVLSDAQGAAITDGEGVATIIDDDGAAPPSTPRIDIDEQKQITEVDSGLTTLSFNVTLEKPWTAPVTVNYDTRDGEADGVGDYVPTSGTLTFAPGETVKTINVPIKNDDIHEASPETFSVDLTGQVNAVLGRSTGNGIIIDDDPAAQRPKVNFSNASITEGNSGTKQLVFTMTLEFPATEPGIANYNTRNQTAGEGDYVPTSGQVTFAPGETVKQVAVTIKGDTKVENDETFFFESSGGGGGIEFGNVTAIGTIVNDDGNTSVLPKISIADASTDEGDVGVKTMTFNLSLDKAWNQAVTVAYRTRNQTAGEGDYGVTSGTVTFAAGQTSRTVSITIKGDTKVENNETFAIDLSSPVNATLADGTGVGTIRNDD